jgi:hypothetical protein
MSKTNESLMQRRTAAVPRGVGQIHPIFADRAENATVIDVEGSIYIGNELYFVYNRIEFLKWFLRDRRAQVESTYARVTIFLTADSN